MTLGRRQPFATRPISSSLACLDMVLYLEDHVVAEVGMPIMDNGAKRLDERPMALFRYLVAQQGESRGASQPIIDHRHTICKMPEACRYRFTLFYSNKKSIIERNSSVAAGGCFPASASAAGDKIVVVIAIDEEAQKSLMPHAFRRY